MTFISYAQNFEDVVLKRAFHGVDKGFYVDVGAHDPIIDSVTKSFYDNGWCGINIEPVKEWFEKLKQDRPHDINLQVAAGARKGNLNFYEFVGTGLSTLVESVAKQHAQKFEFETRKYKVPVMRLTSICEQYGQADIHFLKIDVEGYELTVLRGLNLNKIRPWVILVESTLPTTNEESYESWDPILIAAEYEFAYFDGLNRFYIAKEHQEIRLKLAVPPNVFDDYLLSGKANNAMHRHVEHMQNSLSTAQQQNQSLQKSQQETEQHKILSEARIQAAESESAQNEALMRVQETELKTQAVHHVALLRERETKIKAQAVHYDELLLKKKAKQQEITSKLNTRNQQVKKLKASLVDFRSKVKKLSSTQKEALEQNQVLERNLLGLQEKVAIRNKNLLEKQKSFNSLNDNWEAAKQKIDEIQQSNHHWWTESERLKLELMNVYASKSWQITWPFRGLLQLFGWVLSLPKRLVSWLLHLPKRLSQATTEANEHRSTDLDLTALTPSARSIYHELKTAIERHRKKTE